jgi:hypothetical protein
MLPSLVARHRLICGDDDAGRSNINHSQPRRLKYRYGTIADNTIKPIDIGYPNH